MIRRAFVCAVAIALPAACAGQPSATPPARAIPGSAFALRPNSQSPIRHIVIIVQENRTPDYLFQGVPGADIAQSGLDSRGEIVKLQPVSLAAPYDLQHGNEAFRDDYDNGQMDGFDRHLPRKYHVRPYGYAPRTEVKPYYQMAVEYVLADRMFETNQSGSFPAHQYLVSGTSSALPYTRDEASSNGLNGKIPGKNAPVGCDAPPRSIVDTIDPQDGRPGPTPYPCFERPTLADLLDRAGLKWRFYEHNLGVGLWHSFDAIRHVRYGPDYADVRSPSQAVLNDVAAGQLADVTWIMPPNDAYSDHSGSRSTKGPSWVAAIVNAIGKSRFWKSSAILIVWDDWGGWYDHVPPPQLNGYELGFRVPLLVVSPYAKKGYVSHVQYEFGSLLKFAESTFSLGSLHATDARAADLSDAFDFTQSPRPFVRIKAPPFSPGPDARTGSPNVEDP